MNYAGFWLRFAAFIIDSIILTPVVLLVELMLGGSGPSKTLAYIGGFLIRVAYCAAFESSARQATPGKLVVRIKVIDLNGNRISLGRAIGRQLGTILSGALTLTIGYAMAGFTTRKQAIHDMIAGTLVVRKEPDLAPNPES